MSNALAIAAVTTLLDYRITQALARNDVPVSLESVTAKPLDKAREGGENTNQINIFLYQTLHNAAWRNQDMPNRVRPGETGRPPLALNLSYLITAYGKNNDDIEGQQLLGMAMQTLHDQPEIHPRHVERAIASSNLALSKRELLVSSDLKNQIERIRLVPQILSVEEVSKMWATFQAPYRISAAYEASVVLIESTTPVRTPLPVLMRGDGDRGVLVQASLLPPVPTLESLSWPSQALNLQPSITLAETSDDPGNPNNKLTLQGHHFTQSMGQPITPTVVRFIHPLQTSPIDLPIEPAVSAQALTTLRLTPDLNWLAGFYTVSLGYSQDSRAQWSNALAVAIAPTIVSDSVRITGQTLTLTCRPAVTPDQTVSLLLGSRAIAYEWDPEESQPRATLEFNLRDITPGNYFIRLRVDGVDSHLIIPTDEGTPQFNPEYQVTI